MGQGRLFVVATPIGNLEDITLRALRVLKSVRLVAAEDTRHSRKLLQHYQIDTPLTSYHEHNETGKAQALVGVLKEGRDVALITDAGTPCISDPGYRIVRAARDAGIEVVAVPGPSAVVAALSVSGLPPGRFTFHGFFPRKQNEAGRVLAHLKAAGGTHVFYESPHRVAATLGRIEKALPDAEVCVTRELTKTFEEVAHGSAGSLRTRFSGGPVRGECVVLIHAEAQSQLPGPLRIRELVERAMAKEGLSRRDAVREIAAQLGVPRNVVYDAAGES
ncbi:MAG: ribosomal RNA small subunit methyltransferase I [Candidatus Hydrogenedentota bacterium]